MGSDIPFAMRHRSTKYRLIAIYILLLLFCAFVYFQSLFTSSAEKKSRFILEKRNIGEQLEDQPVSYHHLHSELSHKLADF